MKEEIIINKFCDELIDKFNWLEKEKFDLTKKELINKLINDLSQFDIQAVLDELPSRLEKNGEGYILEIRKLKNNYACNYFSLQEDGEILRYFDDHKAIYFGDIYSDNFTDMLTQLKEKLKAEKLIGE